MKWALPICVAALVLALVDFARSTLPLLREQHQLRGQLAGELALDAAQLHRLGPPPTAAELSALTVASQECRRVAAAEHASFFANARALGDYLHPVSERPASDDLDAARPLLEERLLRLALELRSSFRFPTSSLGIQFPSATVPVTGDRGEFEDQLERTLLTSWVVAWMREIEALELEEFRLHRRPDGRLVAALQVTAGIDETLAFFEGILSAAPELPPRELLSWDLAPLAPEQWGRSLALLRGPPVRLRIELSPWNPAEFDQSEEEGPPDG